MNKINTIILLIILAIVFIIGYQVNSIYSFVKGIESNYDLDLIIED